jgi:outer membrane protein insertion porin family
VKGTRVGGLAAVRVVCLLAGGLVLPGARLAVAQDLQASSELPSSFAEYQGRTVTQIEFRGIEGNNQGELRQMLAIKPGEQLERDKVRDSITALYETGRFADIQVEAQKAPGREVVLVFVASPNYFVGEVDVEEAPAHPSSTQIINASKLQLGELYTREKLESGLKRIGALLEENGYYHARVTDQEEFDRTNQQVDVHLKVELGPQATVGGVTVTGKPLYTATEIRDAAHLHPGDSASSDRIKDALQRLRKKYLKKNRLLAQISVEHTYRPEKDAVDYTLNIDPGPRVQITVEGYHLRRSVIKSHVPVYEENALDEDLLNEGKRNLLDYMQTRGYFEASVDFRREEANDLLRVTYVINPGARHKLVRVTFTGNHYFLDNDLRSRMQVQTSGRLLSHGRYSQTLLASDIRGLEELYRAQGFAQVKITPAVIDDYEGVTNQLAINLQVEEGAQTRVGALHFVGNNTLSDDELRSVVSTLENQPFSEFNVSNDRDTILNEYFNRGFPNASFQASAQPMEDQPNRVSVTFTIHEGEQVFVNRVLVSGLNFTRPAIVRSQLVVQPGDPLSQVNMLATQKRLYNLGIFNQVDTAVQNPEGKEPSKNVLVNIREAKRYTFNYGVGIEFQTGQPSGAASPTGRTGVSPRVSFDVTRLNFRGRDHTITLKSHAGRLQQRVLLGYEAPRWFNSRKWRLALTGFYDNTLDVTTFTSKRLEGSITAQQSVGQASTDEQLDRLPKIFYRMTYRRVQATNFALNFTSNQVPLLSQPARVGLLGVSYIRNRRDNDLETTKGSYYAFDADVASNYFGSQADFSRLLLQNSSYYTIKKKFVFARSTRIGIETPYGSTRIFPPGQPIPSGASVIPLPERFFSGGGNSHRGFGLNQAGPRDPNSGFPVGGSGLFLNNLELRLPPVTLPFLQDNLSFALFHDAGNVFNTGHDMFHSLLQWSQKDPELCRQQSTYTQCDFNYISHAIGVGVRYKTPIGPVRFDFGYNLNPPVFPSFETDSQNQQVFAPKQLTRFNVYFSIGQTF